MQNGSAQKTERLNMLELIRLLEENGYSNSTNKFGFVEKNSLEKKIKNYCDNEINITFFCTNYLFRIKGIHFSCFIEGSQVTTEEDIIKLQEHILLYSSILRLFGISGNNRLKMNSKKTIEKKPKYMLEVYIPKKNGKEMPFFFSKFFLRERTNYDPIKDLTLSHRIMEIKLENFSELIKLFQS